MKKLLKKFFAVIILFIIVCSFGFSAVKANAVRLPRKLSVPLYEDMKIYLVVDNVKTEVTDHTDMSDLMDIFSSMRLYEISLKKQLSCPFYEGDRIEFENLKLNKTISVYPGLDGCANYEVNYNYYYLYYDTADLLRERFEEIGRKYGMRFLGDDF